MAGKHASTPPDHRPLRAKDTGGHKNLMKISHQITNGRSLADSARPRRGRSGRMAHALGGLLALLIGCFTPSTKCAPAYTAGSHSGALRRRNVVSATWRTFQIMEVADSTRLNRVAAVVRSRTAANGASTTFVVRKWRQCSRGHW